MRGGGIQFLTHFFAFYNYDWMTLASVEECRENWWNFPPKCNALSLLLNYPLIITMAVAGKKVGFDPLTYSEKVTQRKIREGFKKEKKRPFL